MTRVIIFLNEGLATMEKLVISLPPEIETRLQGCTDLPSPPKVALRILELVEDPDLEIETVVLTLAMDPALSVKIALLLTEEAGR